MGSLKNRVKRLQKHAKQGQDIITLFQAAERGEAVPAEITAALATAERELDDWQKERQWAR